MEDRKNTFQTFIYKQKTLLFFVGLSFFLWFLSKFSQRFDSLQTYDLEIIEVPTNKKFIESPPDEIQLMVQASGFELLFNQIFRKKITMDYNIGLIQKNDEHILLKSKQRNLIQKQLGSEIKMQMIIKDSLYFYMSTFAVKKVPVLADIKVDFQKGYHLSKPVLTSPDSIEISGPSSVLEKIEWIKTQKIDVNQLDQTKKIPAKINLSLYPKSVNYAFNDVDILLSVEQFTEGQFEVPIQLLNVPSNQKVTIFPQKIKVVFNVGMQHYKKLDANQFSVVCDYNNRLNEDRSFLNPKIKSVPPFVKNVRLIPNQIEYLVVK